MKRGLHLVVLTFMFASSAHARDCARPGEMFCAQDRAGVSMEWRCEKTGSVLTPIETGRRCPAVASCNARVQHSHARIAAWNARCVGAGSVRTPALYQSCARERTAMRAEQAQILADCPQTHL